MSRVLKGLWWTSLSVAYAKISMEVLRELELAPATNVVINLKRLDLKSVILPESVDRRGALVDALKRKSSKATQVIQRVLNIIPLFESVHHTESFWIDNTIHSKLRRDEIEKLIGLDEVLSITAPGVAYIDQESNVDNVATENQWGIDKIEASAAWQRGYTGKGIVIGSIDTGVRSTHEMIKKNFRAENGWYDPYGFSEVPVDYSGHGSHTVGTMVGNGGYGVAPDAQWIACVGCGPTSCTQASLTACAQFMLCPTDPNGNNEDCSKAPRIINNSWGAKANVLSWFEPSITAWRTAGIIPVFSNGNIGTNGCGSVNSPGNSPQVIAVGATDMMDSLPYFSSLGPTYDNRTKPDLTAPGVNIASAGILNDTAILLKSGSSMAAPHVAGTVALYLSAYPSATFDQVYRALTTSTVTSGLTGSTLTCGNLTNTQFPNNNFGYGRLMVSSIEIFSVPTTTPATTNIPTAAPTPAPTLAFTPTSTPAPTPIFTPSSIPAPTPIFTPSSTPAPTPIFTPSSIPAPTPIFTPSSTPAPTPIFTPSSTPAPTPIFTPSSTPAPTPIFTPSSTPAPTPIFTPSSTPAPTPIFTPSSTVKPTPVPTSSLTLMRVPSLTFWSILRRPQAPTPITTIKSTPVPTPSPSITSTPAPTPITTITPISTTTITPAPSTTPSTTIAPAPTTTITPAPTPLTTITPVPSTTITPPPAPTTTMATTPVPTPSTTVAPTPAPTGSSQQTPVPISIRIIQNPFRNPRSPIRQIHEQRI